jgi:hypothetical protein
MQQLFRAACISNTENLDKAIDSLSGKADPLWPALARHLSRRSSAADRAFLEGLVCNPAQREPPLSWALQYWVRGDLLLENGSETTLDTLCDEVGLPRLPYLEDMPDELQVKF